MKIAFKVNGVFDSRDADGSAILDKSIFNVKPANDEILYIELDSFGNIEKAKSCCFGMKASNHGFWQDSEYDRACVNDAYFLIVKISIEFLPLKYSPIHSGH